MDDHFIVQLLGTAFGGIAAYAAIKVEVAIAKQIAQDAKASAADSHDRLDQHIEAHHTVKGK